MAAQLSVEMTGDERKLAKKLVRAEANIDSLKRKLREAGKVGRRSGAQISTSMKGIHRSMLVLAGASGFGGIQQALNSINRSYITWLQNQREISNEAQKGAKSTVAFSALQPVGLKKIRRDEAIALGESYGLQEDRDGITEAVQALQSARGGDFKAGMDAARTVFAGTKVDVPLDRGLELETIGASLGLDAGDAIRMAYASGQASARTPSVLSAASAGLTFFDDQLFGISAAGAMAQGVKKDELGTYLRAAGIALSSGSSDSFQKTFKSLGVEDATRLERLKALADAGINTTEKLNEAGLQEIRQVKAVATLVQNMPDLFRIMGEVEKRAKPGLLSEQRMETEREDPNLAVSGNIDVLKAMYKNEQAYGKDSLLALHVDQEDLIRGNALADMGQREFLFWDLIDEQGRASEFSTVLASINAFFAPGPGGFLVELTDKMEEVRETMEKNVEATRELRDDGRRNAERRRRINPDAQNE